MSEEDFFAKWVRTRSHKPKNETVIHKNRSIAGYLCGPECNEHSGPRHYQPSKAQAEAARRLVNRIG